MHSSKTYDGKIAGLYDLEETLGSGHFAVVKLARHVFTGEKVAVKVIDKTRLDDVSRAHLFQEVRCMKLVQHPNVVRLYEVIDTHTKLYLILELGDGGDLYDYIMKHEGGLEEDTAREYFRQIVRAISYCHQLHVVHRDLKPENVVFFERLGVVKLTDFGFSNKFCPGQKLETSCGSLAYCAPEILLGDSYDAPAVDVWSLGVILYMLVVGQAPFREANDSETLTMIMDCKYSVPAHVSRTCRRLISRMLVREPSSRATLHDITQDPWLGGSTEEESLVSNQHVSEDERSLIINKMVAGGIASKDAVLEALERNDYNHITATYFLLAERKLRAHRLERTRPVAAIPSSASSHSFTCSPEGQKDSRSELVVPEVTQGRTRKCSIVQEEEDEEEYRSQELAPTISTFSRRGSRSEGKLSAAVQERIAEERRANKQDVVTRVDIKDDSCCRPNSAGTGKWRTSVERNPLDSHVVDAIDPKSKTLPSLFEQRRTKLHKARTASCSSSDASDDDSESRKKRTAKLSSDSNRRHSHDDSSDGGDPGGGDSGSSAGGGVGGGGTNQREPPPPRSQPPSNSAPHASRPHRARRRAPDPRLRESQSLNRITEVQEPATELPVERLTVDNKPCRGFGARILQSWARRHNKAADDEKENRCRKVKLLGRYFQVSKKLCIPLPSLVSKGRLYKARSCGALVRDDCQGGKGVVLRPS